MKKLLFFLLCVGSVIMVTAQGTVNIKMDATKHAISSASKPLYFVDGFETGEDCMVLDPSNIESINVLKNQAATNVYGERAKNGVILIKTKSGTSFNYITDYINLPNGANSSITNVKLNGVPVSDMKKLLIDKSSLVSTMISSDMQLDKDCTPTFHDTLVITTKFPGGSK